MYAAESSGAKALFLRNPTHVDRNNFRSGTFWRSCRTTDAMLTQPPRPRPSVHMEVSHAPLGSANAAVCRVPQTVWMVDFAHDMYGQWWLAEDPSVSATGRLTVEQDGSTRLDVVGALLQVDFERHTILGLAEGRPVTLLRCLFFSSKGIGGGPGAGSQQVRVARALVGAHVVPEHAMFGGASIVLENLPGFLAADITDRTLEDPHFTHVAGVNDQHSTASFDGWIIAARSRADYFQLAQSRSATQVSSTVTAYLDLTPPTPVSADAFDGMILHLSDLMTLASGVACGVVSRTLFIHQIGPEPSEERLDRHFTPMHHPVEVFGRRVHTPSPTLPGVSHDSFRFTCQDAPFSELVPGWLAIRRDAETACNVFFGIQYARPGFTETRLLLSAIAAEGFHAAFSDRFHAWPAEQFADMKGKLLAVLDDPKERSWVESKIENRVSFRRRLRELARMPHRPARRELVADPEAWVEDVVAARNALAHTGNHLHDTDPFVLERVTAGLLTLVLMSRLGLDTEVQMRAARLLRVEE